MNATKFTVLVLTVVMLVTFIASLYQFGLYLTIYTDVYTLSKALKYLAGSLTIGAVMIGVEQLG